MTKEHECHFEEQVVLDMCATTNGWIQGTSDEYNKVAALYEQDLLNYIKSTQSEAYAAYQKRYHDKADDELVSAVLEKIKKTGGLRALKKGIQGYPAKLKLCQFGCCLYIM